MPSAPAPLRRRPAIAVAALLALPVQASAQDGCPAQLTLGDLEGAYTLEIGKSLVSGGGTTIALDATDSFPVTLDEREGSLYMEAGPNVIVLDWADDSDAPEDRGFFATVAGITASDLEFVIACELENLQMLVGGGLSSSVEGTPVEFEYRFLVLQPDWMVGTLDWSGGGIETKRLAFLTAR